MEQIKQPLFPLGQVVATPGALDKTHPLWMANCLARQYARRLGFGGRGRYRNQQ